MTTTAAGRDDDVETGPVRLRPAVERDAAAVAELYLTSRREGLPWLRPVHDDETTRRWIRDVVIGRGSSGTWVAVIGSGPIVGMMALVGECVDQLYIRPGHFRRGIGGRLLAKAKQLAPGGRLRLYAFQRNARARAFYEARGFVAIAFGDGSGNAEGEPDVLYEWTAG